MWLPFIFSDTRSGRHSGILAPQFGIGDIVRNSPTYRRNVDHVGYYWAISDYMDFATWLDWRSSAGSTVGDPGWLRLNGDWQLQVDRPVHGRAHRRRLHARSATVRRTLAITGGTSRTSRTTAASTLSVELRHEHDAPAAEHVQSVHGARDDRVAGELPDQVWPGVGDRSAGRASSIRVASRSIRRSRPSRSRRRRSRSAGGSSGRRRSASIAATSSTSISRASARSTYSLDPVTGIRDSVADEGPRLVDVVDDVRHADSDLRARPQELVPHQPAAKQLPATGRDLRSRTPASCTDTRIFAATYRTDVDWAPDFTLPPFARNRFNLTPSISFAERRSRTVLGRDRAHEREVRPSDEAIHVRRVGVADDLRTVPGLRTVQRASVTRSRRRSATRTRRQRR